MNNSNIKNQESLLIIDGELIGTVLYLIAIIISILLIINQRNIILEKEPLFETDKFRILVLANRVFILLLTLWFFYINYKTYKYTKESNNDTKLSKLQLFSSFILVIGAIIGLYIANSNNVNQSVNIENPEI